ncbi:unannotated protein [freshwater metagenome]|uniref:Unannotated protein n=1 Tax=freshwater metagenome TaxID=449393 RepID=A0A6J7Q767_9ZZZZ
MQVEDQRSVLNPGREVEQGRYLEIAAHPTQYLGLHKATLHEGRLIEPDWVSICDLDALTKFNAATACLSTMWIEHGWIQHDPRRSARP